MIEQIQYNNKYATLAPYKRLMKNDFIKRFYLKQSFQINDGFLMRLDAYPKTDSNNLSLSLEYDFNEKKIKKCYCRYCEERNDCFHLTYLIDKYNTEVLPGIFQESDYIEQTYEELLRKKKLRMQAIEKKESISLFNILKSRIVESEAIPVLGNVGLIPTIVLKRMGNNTLTHELELRIGIDKTYVVKSIASFIQAINNKETVSYGKGLSFVHSIDAFNEEAKKVIILLQLAMKNTYVSNYSQFKSLPIDSFFVDEIMKIYESKNINIKKEDVIYDAFISKESVDIKFQVRDYKFVIEDRPDLFVIPGLKQDYLFDQFIVKKIDVRNDAREIVKFIYDNPSFKLEYIKEEFANQIYTRYSDILDVDDSMKIDMDIHEVSINSYFDYDKGEILLETKYRVGEETVSKEELRDTYGQGIRLDKYDRIIENLGFSDNVLEDTAKIATFISINLSSLKAVANVYLSERLKNLKIKKTSSGSSTLSYNKGLMNFRFDDLHYSNEELAKIYNAIKKNQRFVKLNKDTIVEVDSEFAEKMMNTVSDFSLDTKHLADEQQLPLYQSLKLLGETKEYVDFTTDDILKEIISAIANYKDSNFKAPKELNDTLRDYQKDAFKWMKTLCKYKFSGILADDMGLGKTLEVISLIADDDEVHPSLIVCPKSLAYNWHSEFTKWKVDVEAVTITGNKTDRDAIINSINLNEKKVYITSYDSLKNDLSAYQDKQFRFMILDEAQFIKNHNTLKAQSVKEIKSEQRFVLTGTPIENTVVDLWSLFDFLMPNYLFNYHEFKNQYEKEITQSRNKEVINKLVKKITPFILRRTKQEVLKDLPEKIETVQYAEMTHDQRMLYEAEIARAQDYMNTKAGSKIDLLACLTRLRQICVDPSMYVEGFKDSSAKVDLAVGLIEEYIESGHKVLLFSQFTKVFDTLRTELEKRHIEYFELTGKTSALARVQMAEEFNKEDAPQKVFLVSLKAGGTGLNLVGADIVIHLDPWWNISAENQATDRAHRIGQRNVVRVIKIVCEDSIEQKVIELQEAKKQVIQDVIANNDENIVKLTDADLNYLLS